MKGSFAILKTKQNKNTQQTGIFLLEVWKCLSDAFWPLRFLIIHRLLILFGILCMWSVASLYFHELLFVSGLWQSDSDVYRCESPCTLCELFWAVWMLRNHFFRYSPYLFLSLLPELPFCVCSLDGPLRFLVQCSSSPVCLSILD